MLLRYIYFIEMNQMILSIDVGSKNMVLCKVQQLNDDPFFSIHYWRLVSCHKDGANIASTCNECVSMLLNEIYTNGLLDDVDGILIESQPTRNIKMKVLSHCIQVTFLMIKQNDHFDFTIDFADPKTKLKLCQPSPTTRSYLQNKRAAILTCGVIMDNYKKINGDDEFVRLFNSSKKKDDLADSLLQALAHMHYRNPYTLVNC